MLRTFVCLVIMTFALAPAVTEAGPRVGNCPVFPYNNFWNTRVDTLPVHPSSATWIASIGANTRLHADWGNNLADNYGIPFVTVTAAQPLVPIVFDSQGYADESDPGPYPIPPDAPIEGGPASAGDRHVIVVETTNCRLYELYVARPLAQGAGWSAYSAANYDLRSNALRPAGWTSADAAGLPIFPGLVRWEEVAAGEIGHAIRFTASNIWGTDAATGAHKFLWPARHWSGSSTSATRPPMGARLRLKASFDISRFDARTQVILRAFKQYGLVLADAGSNWYFQGVSDTHWPDVVFSELRSIAGSNFEAVDTSPLQIDPDSAQAAQIATVASNFNGDARSELLWRNASTGENAIWQMDATALRSSALIPTVSDPGWRIVATADFDGDAKTDILWRHAATGANAVWLMAGTTLGSSALLPTVTGSAWAVAGAGDFDGDGKADILWRNGESGENAIWLMDGVNVAHAALLNAVPDANWSVSAVGDFDGDGKNDMFWRNTRTGETAVWLMNGLGVASAALLPTVAQSWSVAGTGDYDGDGKRDLLWRNALTGENAIWLMNGAARAAGGHLARVTDASWKIVGTGDYDGDGKADILWRNTSTGDNAVWLMDAFAMKASALIPAVSDPSWAVVAR
ncbi:MAG: FG-GAP repeat domain-containing protein [Burkholderiales bacterium]